MQVFSSSRDDELGRCFKWSLIIHGIIIVFVIFKSLVFPGETIIYTPTLRVDIVGLPDILKKDLIDVSKTLPTDLETPPKAAQEPETNDPDELLLKPKSKKDVKEEKAKEKVRDVKMSSALARIRAMEKIREESRAENEAVVIKGNQVSKGTSLSGDAKEAAIVSYYDLVKDKLIDNWALPPWLARQHYSAQVQITINASGRITSVNFLKNSGNPAFDDAIRSTLQESQPLPPPPEEVLSTVQNLGVKLGFPL